MSDFQVSYLNSEFESTHTERWEVGSFMNQAPESRVHFEYHTGRRSGAAVVIVEIVTDTMNRSTIRHPYIDSAVGEAFISGR
eukprot:COSAG02_NODE_992_length_15399_cov_164.326797_8_plen_82_part_00